MRNVLIKAREGAGKQSQNSGAVVRGERRAAKGSKRSCEMERKIRTSCETLVIFFPSLKPSTNASTVIEDLATNIRKHPIVRTKASLLFVTVVGK